MDTTPDFATLFAESPLAPRMAARLWVIAQLAADEFRQGTPDIWVGDLPSVAATFLDDQFVAAFGARFELLANRLADGADSPVRLTTCTADEVALHMVIGFASETEADDLMGKEWIEELPSRELDDDFGWTKEILFEDLDIEVLYDPAMDGAEDPDSDVYRVEGFANLHPRDWFKPFDR